MEPKASRWASAAVQNERCRIGPHSSIAESCAPGAHDPAPTPDPKQPRTKGPFPSRQLLLGEPTVMALERRLHAPPSTTFSVTSSSAAVQASISGDSLLLEPMNVGAARIAVTASNDVDASTHPAEETLDAVVHPPGTPPNDPPRAFWTRRRIIPAGFGVPYVIAEFFRDPEGCPLTFTAQSDAPHRVAVSVSGSDVILEGRTPAGEAVVTLIATDHGGLPARTRLAVSVVEVVR